MNNIIKRNGNKVEFERAFIFNAIKNSFLSENIFDENVISSLTDEVVKHIEETNKGETTSVEYVQDVVEQTMMESGHHKVVRNFILYREEHKLARQKKLINQIKKKELEVVINESESVIYNPKIVGEKLRRLAPDLIKVSISEMVETISGHVYHKIPKLEIDLLVLNAARERIEKHYEYSSLASRIILDELYEIVGVPFNHLKLKKSYQNGFKNYIKKGIELEMLNPDLAGFDLDEIVKHIQPEKDKKFLYLGLQILMDRYLLRDRKNREVYELPQWFWMRVAMGLSLKEKEKEKRAAEFYAILSDMDLVSSTPTLFNSGTLHSQMSSCYLNTAPDSLDGIFKLYADNAKLSKWAGGIGSDWTRVRGTGSKITGTNGESQGVIPFIKIFNDVALAVNQGGKRKGAMCAYIEPWHKDFEQFMELKKNTGDERRRTHDINTACWIPDLFMKRVRENGDWHLFCPDDVPDLHDLYGKEFDARFEYYEKQDSISKKSLKALDLWRRILTLLFETGHPWITFKDAANVRNPQSHVGVIHSSNLCTEITLNTSDDETAVCNLASINLSNMLKDGKLDEKKIQKTIRTGIRMLDNVIDNNYYPIKEAETANLKHRAIGLGMMGYQDCLYKLGIKFESEENLKFADESMEMVSYFAIQSSAELAKERGTYESYKGSKWDRSLFPLDTLDLLEESRGYEIKVNRDSRLDWDKLKSYVKKYGMRNSNTMAIAPTATIANICGVYPCTEPAYKNIYMKENLSGNFVVLNIYLVDELDQLGLWNDEFLRKIKLKNGSVQGIDGIPEHIQSKYKETFEIAPDWVLRAASLRSKWIDQSASTNVFLDTKSGKILNDTYMMAWDLGLKTTYYLRSLGATQVTKTADTEALQSTPRIDAATEGVGVSVVANSQGSEPSVCLLADPDCEACQ
ncbi:ribonucleoside-diphosphate reductase subunit alpha [bacterium]|nr:ribonucleoside-diphosphate reductase subunit alpha [bacterium]